MKKVLITGKSSYIGNAFQKTIAGSCADEIQVEMISLRFIDWENYDFSSYDTILHLAGIAHVDHSTKFDRELAKKYQDVNCDLTVKVAEKAKKDGVRQFIFMSSIIIFGDSAPIGKQKVIYANTKPNPSGYYGQSKLAAEEGLRRLENKYFLVYILRPPMVYGEHCKGNFTKLQKLAGLTPVFPKIQNQRSVISIRNLCDIIKEAVLRDRRGICHPQDSEYKNTSEWVKEMAADKRRKVWLVPGFTWLFILLEKRVGAVDKLFGSLTYAKQESEN